MNTLFQTPEIQYIAAVLFIIPTLILYVSSLNFMLIKARGKSTTLKDLNLRISECIKTGDMEGYRELIEAVNRLGQSEVISSQLFSKINFSFNGHGNQSIKTTDHRGRLFEQEAHKQTENQNEDAASSLEH